MLTGTESPTVSPFKLQAIIYEEEEDDWAIETPKHTKPSCLKQLKSKLRIHKFRCKWRL